MNYSCVLAVRSIDEHVISSGTSQTYNCFSPYVQSSAEGKAKERNVKAKYMDSMLGDLSGSGSDDSEEDDNQ